MSNTVIRPLVPDDLEAFYALRLQGLQTNPEAFMETAEEWEKRPLPEIEERFRSACTSPYAFILGAFLNDELAGIMGFQRDKGEKVKHKGRVWGAFVAPDARRRGLAAQMLDDLIRMARGMPGLQQIQLSVVTGYEAPLSLYESRGFKAYGLEKNALCEGNRCTDLTHMVLFL